MSKTYKHQLKYKVREWWAFNYYSPGYIPVIYNGDYYRITLPPQPENECPYPYYYGDVDNSRPSKYYKLSYQKLRHKWKRLLHENDEFKIGRESLKPENVDWDIW